MFPKIPKMSTLYPEAFGCKTEINVKKKKSSVKNPELLQTLCRNVIYAQEYPIECLQVPIAHVCNCIHEAKLVFSGVLYHLLCWFHTNFLCYHLPQWNFSAILNGHMSNSNWNLGLWITPIF